MFLTEIFEKKSKLEAIKEANIPAHVAIIMDGNRRWAKKRFLPAAAGHWAGANALKNIVRSASDVGIKSLTVYAFSTENWQRPQVEIDSLFKVLESYLLQERNAMQEEGVCLKTIGDLSKFPKYLLEVIEESKEATKLGNKINLVLALNYGSRDEMTRAIRSIAKACVHGGLDTESITEDVVHNYLDTSFLKDPELLIRTSGQMRLSNFMLWQLSYTEVYVTDTLWPDFSKEDLYSAILEYQKREIRRGS